MNTTLPLTELRSWLEHFGAAIRSKEDLLNRLDSATGDGEHGSNLVRGVEAMQPVLEEAHPDAQVFFNAIGMAVVNSVGGASGALYGTVFLRMSDQGAGTTHLDLPRLLSGFASAEAGIAELGRVRPGDKTLLDAIHPAVRALQQAASAGADLAAATEAAARSAEAGRDATAHMRAMAGRASYLGDRSLGHVDAGATSMAQLFRSLHSVASAL